MAGPIPRRISFRVPSPRFWSLVEALAVVMTFAARLTWVRRLDLLEPACRLVHEWVD